VAEGILQVRGQHPEAVVEFNRAFAHLPLLTPLLTTMAERMPAITTRTEFLKQQRLSDAAVPRASERAELPFGTVTQSSILMSICRGPVCIYDIFKETSRSRNTIRTVLNTFEECGLIVTTTIGKGPALSRWATLNEFPPAYEVATRIRHFAWR
jgi:hypothetical protein